MLLQALDQEPTERNRQNTSAAIKPLIEAVENLNTFASSPEFASIPAKISQKVLFIFISVHSFEFLQIFLIILTFS